MKEQTSLFKLPIEQMAKTLKSRGESLKDVHEEYFNLASYVIGLQLYGSLFPDQAKNRTSYIKTLQQNLERPGAQAAWVMAASWMLRTRVPIESPDDQEANFDPIHMMLAKETLEREESVPEDDVAQGSRFVATKQDLEAFSFELARTLGGTHEELRTQLRVLKPADEWDIDEEVRGVDDILWADRKILDFLWSQLKRRIVDSEQQDELQRHLQGVFEVRRQTHKQALTQGTRSALFEWWIPSNVRRASKQKLELPRIWWDAARIVWCFLVRPKLVNARLQANAFDKPKEAQIRSVTLGQHSYSKVHKVTGALSWAFGTSATGHVIEVGGDHYTGAPVLAQYVSRAISTQAPGRSHRVALRLNRPIHSENNQDVLPGQLIENVQFVLSPYEAKTFFYLMTTVPMDQSVVQTTLGELVGELVPEHDATHLSRHCEQVSVALRTLASAQLVLPDDTVVDLFSIRQPRDPTLSKSDQKIAWGLDPNFLHLLESEIPNNSEELLKQLNGAFLVNMSAVMRFEHNDANLMRHYVMTCAIWNDAQAFSSSQNFNAEAVPAYTDTQWGVLTNSFSKSAQSYLMGESKEDAWRKRASKEKKKIREELIELEKIGLIKILWIR